MYFIVKGNYLDSFSLFFFFFFGHIRDVFMKGNTKTEFKCCGSESLLMAAKLLQTSLHNAISSQSSLYNQAKILQGEVVLIIVTLLIVLHLLTEYCFCFPLWSKRNCDEE